MNFQQADLQAVNQNATNAMRFVSSGVPNGSPGFLLSRNREWGGMYAPRWQLGAGRAMRINLAADNLEEARLAFLAVAAGCQAIHADGVVPFTVPVSLGVTPTATEIAQAAAFFLSEAATAYLALSQYSKADIAAVSSRPERDAMRDAIIRGIRWLDTQKTVLWNADNQSPNRLLFDALAFYAGGKVAGSAYNHQNFVDQALSLYSNGVFVEKGGYDTHYQAVAINQIVDLLLAGYGNSQLEQAHIAAANWYLPRIDANGVIHSEGNTRTCWNGESVLGTAKKMSPIEVWRALLYVGIRANDPKLKTVAAHVAGWVNTNPAETCIL